MINYVELRLYDSFAASSYKLLPDFVDLSFDTQFDALASVEFTYPLSEANALGVADQKLLGVVCGFSNGTTAEVERYILDNTNDEKVSDGKRLKTVGGKSILAILADALVYPSNWNPATKSGGAPAGHNFTDASIGTIFRTLIARAKARGTLSQVIETSFSGTQDSAGRSWTHLLDQDLSSGTSYLEVLTEMMERGMVDAKFNGWNLNLYDVDATGYSAFGSEIPIGTLEIRPASNVTEMTTNTSSEESASAVFVEGDEGNISEVENTSAESLIGRRRERYIQAGGIKIKEVLDLLANFELNLFARIPTEETVGVAMTPTAVPFRDYNAGDWLWVRYEGSEVPTKRRVRQVAVSIDSDRNVDVGLTLNTILAEADVRLQRQLDSYTGGGGSTFNGPANTSVDTTVPNTPDLVDAGLSSNTLVDSNGQYVAAVTASWPAITTNQDGSEASDLAGYELTWRYTGDTVWSYTHFSSDNVHQWAPVAPGSEIEVRARSVDDSSHKSPWSPIARHTVDKDITEPPTPSRPVLTPTTTRIIVEWDGLDNSTPTPQPMPVDFTHVEIWQSQLGSFEPGDAGSEMVGTLTAAGQSSIEGHGYNTDTYVRLVAVDAAGNKSDPASAVSLPARKGQVEAGDIDPNAIEGGPTNAPATPIAPTVSGGIGEFLLRWPSVTPPEGQEYGTVVYQVHASDVQGFSPNAGTLYQTVEGNQATVKRLPPMQGSGEVDPSESAFESRTPASGSTAAWSLGSRFRVGAGGQITALRFWRDSVSPPSSRSVRLYNGVGTLLASVTTSEAGLPAGWVQVALTTPINVAANDEIVVVYDTPGGAAGWRYTDPAPAADAGNLEFLQAQYANAIGVYPSNVSTSYYFGDVVFQTVSGGGGLAGGTPLEYDVPSANPDEPPETKSYYFRLIAVNDLGPSSASPETEAQLVKINSPDIAADQIFGVHIHGGEITGDKFSGRVTLSSLFTTAPLEDANGNPIPGGRHVEIDPTGIMLMDSSNKPVVKLATDPQQASEFNGDIKAQTATFYGAAAFNAKGNEISRDAQLKLALGTTPPQSPPNALIDWPYTQFTLPAGAPFAHADARGCCSDRAGGWLVLYQKGTTADHYVVHYDANGNWLHTATRPFNSEAKLKTSLAYNGTYLCTVQYKGTASRYGGMTVYDYHFVRVSYTLATHTVGSTKDHYWIECDNGANDFIAVGQSDNSGNNNFYAVEYNGASNDDYMLGRLDLSGSTPSSSSAGISSHVQWDTLSGGPWYSNRNSIFGKPVGVIYSSADFGSARFVTAKRSPGLTNLWPFTHEIDGDAVYQSSEAFPGPDDSIVDITSYNATMYSFNSTGKLYRHTALKDLGPSATWTLAHTWRDPDPAGTVTPPRVDAKHETTTGSRTTFTMKKRARLTVSVAQLPARPTPNTTDDVTAVSFYLSNASGSPANNQMWRVGPGNGATELGTGVITYTTEAPVFASPSVNPPTVNDFPGANPGEIESSAVETYRAEPANPPNPPKVEFRGDGYARATMIQPVGATEMFAGPIDSNFPSGSQKGPPPGWLWCDGSAVSRSTYADLFAVIGTTFGVGDSSSTFNLPDMRGRVSVGVGTFATRGDDEGETDEALRSLKHTHGSGTLTVADHTHPITAAPDHSHAGPQHDHGAGSLSNATATNTSIGGSANRAQNPITGTTGLAGTGQTGSSGQHSHGGATELRGPAVNSGKTAQNPENGSTDAIAFLGLNFIIKT